MQGRTVVNEYLRFIEEATQLWVSSGNDPDSISALNSSAYASPQSVTYTHTVSNPAGNATLTRVFNLGVLAVAPASASATAAGGSGSFAATVYPSDSAITATSDQTWLTANVAGGVVSWSAAPNGDGVQRMATIRVATSASGAVAQVFTLTQFA